jgi:hypothetical protein
MFIERKAISLFKHKDDGDSSSSSDIPGVQQLDSLISEPAIGPAMFIERKAISLFKHKDHGDSSRSSDILRAISA